jgi:hypothetical protein
VKGKSAGKRTHERTNALGIPGHRSRGSHRFRHRYDGRECLADPAAQTGHAGCGGSRSCFLHCLYLVGARQRPIEKRHGPFVAILVSSLFFMLVHTTKQWDLIGMVPIVFGAGVLFGTLAWASRSLVFCMIGHTIMDIGLFAYWWTQIAGMFSQRPISETGMDQTFYLECGMLAVAFLIALTAIARLRKLSDV